MANENIIEQLNQYLLDTENLADDFISLKDKLEPIKTDVADVLNELKTKSENSSESSDKVFYLNRYADLIKKIDGIFDARIKRLQNSLNILSKIALTSDVKSESSSGDDKINKDNIMNNLTPEQCAKIFAILQE